MEGAQYGLYWLGVPKLISAGAEISLADDRPFAGKSLKFYIEAYPDFPTHDIVLAYTRDNFGSLSKRRFVYIPDRRGLSNPNNARYAVELPAEEINEHETLEWWIEGVGAKNMLYYSNYGRNFKFHPRKLDVRSSHLEYVTMSISECVERTAMPEPIVVEKFDPEQKIVAREVRAAISVPGLTDRQFPSNVERFVAASVAMRAEVYSDIFSGVPKREFHSFPLSFHSQVDGKFVYQWNMQPALIARPKPGRYSYKLRFSPDGDNWFWIGTHEGPLGGRDRTIVVE